MAIMDVRVLQVDFDDTRSPATQLDRVAERVAAQHGADLVVLPELWLHGAFAPERWREASIAVDGPEIALMAEAARSAGTHLHAGTFIEHAGAGDVEQSPRPLWNTAVLLGRAGEVLATYRKVHRFGFGSGEAELIEAGSDVVAAELYDRDGLPLCKVGLATCYDLRFPEMFRRLVDQGAEMLLVPAAWPLARVEHWKVLGVARAIENQAFVVQCNDGGSHGGLEMGGHSQVVGPTGEVVASASRGWSSLSVSIDLDAVGDIRREFPVLGDRRLAVEKVPT